MSSPAPPRPTRHRAPSPLSQTARRLLPALASVTAVVVVILLLLVLNSRPSKPDAGPAVVPGSPSPTPSTSPSTSPSATASAPSASSSVASSVAPPPVNEPSATQQPTAKPAVTVLNDSRRTGLAAHVAAELRARGWPIRDTGNFRGRVAMTTAYYAAGQRSAAQELAREFPQVKRIAPRFAGLPGVGLTLVVTRDWTG